MTASTNARLRALRGAVSSTAIGVGLFAGAGAHAADAHSQNAAVSAVGEVIVTAQKREESLQKVPVAVTAFTSEMRDKTGMVTAQDQFNFTPGVTYVPDVDRITIRGVGRVTTQIGTDAGVAVYQDGFYVGGPSGSAIGDSTLGTDRVEVLRGPQGTLYGRNSIGGAVNVISRRPDNHFTGEVRASYNNYEGEIFEGRVSGPITDNIRASIMLSQFDQQGGYYHDALPVPSKGSTPGGPNGAGNLLNTATLEPVTAALVAGQPEEGAGTGHGWTANFQLAFDAGKNFDGWIRFVATNQFTRPRDSTGVTAWGTAPLIVPNVFTGFKGDQNPGIYDHRAFFTNTPTQNHLHDDNQLIGQFVWHATGFDVKYVGGYWHYVNNNIIDGDATADPNFRTPGLFGGTEVAANNITYNTNDTQSSWSHEIDFTSTAAGPLQWLAGAYYYNESHDQNFGVPDHGESHLDVLTDYLFAANPFVNFLFPAVGAPVSASPSGPINNPQDLLYYYDAKLKTRSEAIFGQLDWRPDDQWRFTLGGRYSWDQKQGYEQQFSITQITLGDQATLAALDPVLFLVTGQHWPTYSSGPMAGQFVEDFVFEGCSGAGTAAAPPGVVSVNPAVAPCPGQRHLKNSWSAPTGTAGIAYTPTPDTNIYGNYSRGYKSGGYNLGTLAAGATVDPEYIDALEGGWKQNFGRQLQVNVATFYYLYHGLQTLNGTLVQVSPPIVINELVNIQQSRSFGVELETQWSPIEDLLISFNYSYLNTRVLKGCCFVDSSDPTGVAQGAKPVAGAGGAQSIVGNVLPDSPEHKIGANVSYTWRFEPGNLTLSATENWHTDFYYSLFDNPNWLTPGGATTDLRVSWRGASTRYEIIGTVTNLFNAEVPTSVNTLPPNQDFYHILALQPPRVASIEVRYHF